MSEEKEASKETLRRKYSKAESVKTKVPHTAGE